MQTQTLNVVLYPPKEVRDYAVKLSASLESCGGFVLDDTKFFPHVTLYLAEYPNDAIDDVHDTLTQIVPTLMQIGLKPNDYSIEQGYIAVTFAKTEELELMQMSIISACNTVRKGSLRLRDIEKMESYDPVQRENIDMYGFRSVGESFYPHLTLTKCAGPIPVSLPHFDPEKLTFNSATLALMRVGEYGTARELIHTYSI
jgi:2'-5' RNA ligase